MATSFHLVCPACGAVNRVPHDRPATAAKCGGCWRQTVHRPPDRTSAATSTGTCAGRRHSVAGRLLGGLVRACKAMAPVLDALSRELEPRLRVAKLDTDAVPEVAARSASAASRP